MKRREDIDKECLYCKSKGVNPPNKKFKVVAIDRPVRKNLWFHKDCLENHLDYGIDSYEKITEFLNENKDLWLENES